MMKLRVNPQEAMLSLTEELFQRKLDVDSGSDRESATGSDQFLERHLAEMAS